ncbi:DUF4097 family beta strand repeat-containing protein [Lactobacillus mulieris]|uniref:DUF4097 family beta strand repeat-containing protein n=1 Tax=Lactobacillus mulieris TaxID=2508708 RepID=A0AAW5WYQ0_9LACO|nr:DUF4097 family beta strand repeat-containing protein [Lactobacillus mulieris]MCZ3622711.1 DUF4097 family beta strand repeat-containing protein [Lactobacillus mulieris]MCZ3624314.1 DUF4097 family beta strand repeat-containing protein [Lactobacillus mulieris]MCZ3636683.1 DUF4097 family beta strand repeat-containing protein [Lactobacillus mulieris]MCZ3690451.1 DUF4097 family beta strand repeat-containing protein [Lactobacillus mulieris]MCZ3696420.1 DUF4097 family beta strand repeat-containing 
MKSLTLFLDDVFVKIIEDDTFSISFHNCQPEDFEITPGENTTIKQIHSSQGLFIKKKYFSLSFKSKDEVTSIIELKLPSLEHLNGTCDVGGISLRNLTVNTIDIQVDSGLVYLNNIHAEKVSITCDTGTVNADKLIVSDHCDINVDSGTLFIKNSLTSLCGYDIKCETGISKLFGSVKIRSDKRLFKAGVPMYRLRNDTGLCTIE